MPKDARRYHTIVDLSIENSSATQLILLTGRNKRVLEAGPATGYVTEALQARGCQVTAIEKDLAAAELAARFCERMVIGDIEEMDLASTFADDQFDVVMFGDVLEHLVDPRLILEKVRPLLRDGGYVVASIPNIAHGSVRLMLLGGKFAYTEKGLLDHTHLRFFNKSGVETLFQEAGYRISVWRSTSTETIQDPFAEELSLPESDLPPHLVEALRQDPEALTYQFVVRAYPQRARKLRKRISHEVHASRSGMGSVLKALWQADEALGEKDQEIARMRSTLADKEAALADKDAALANSSGHAVQLESRLAAIEDKLRQARRDFELVTNTLGYRLMEQIRGALLWLFPPSSWRRRLYKAVRRLIWWLPKQP